MACQGCKDFLANNNHRWIRSNSWSERLGFVYKGGKDFVEDFVNQITAVMDSGLVEVGAPGMDDLVSDTI